MSTSDMQLIAKNSGMSIGLFITFGAFLFFGGAKMGRLEERMETHQELQTHKGASELFVPRTEVELQFVDIQTDIQEIKDTQKLILLELRK